MRKKLSYFVILPTLLLTLLLPACKKDENSTANSDVFTETFYTNPGDNQIYEVDSAGRKLILMGQKDADGMPLNITQALVDAPDLIPDHRLLMNFNANGTVNQISNPTMGFMTFTYVNDTTVVIKMILPDTLGTYQIIYNPKKLKSKGDCGCGKKKHPVTGPKRADEITFRNVPQPTQKSLPLFTPTKPNSTNVEATITATYDPGGDYVTDLTMGGQYVTNEGKTGAIQVRLGSHDGIFIYSMPDNPAPPPPSGFSSKVYYLLNALCWGSIPKGLSKEGICGEFSSEVPSIGSLICETMLGAYIFICRASTVHKVSQDVFDLYTASKVTITITAQNPILPSQTKTVNFTPAGGTLPDVVFTFNGTAAFLNVHTDPSAPVALEGYTIVAVLIQTGSGGSVPVRLSMVGSDGYTNSQDFQVDVGGTCQLSIPGGALGVRDDITAQINPGSTPQPGQLIKLHIMFQ